MISNLENIFGSTNSSLATQIEKQDRALALEIIDRCTRPLPNEEVSDWACRNLRFDEPKFKEMFTTKLRHYIEEPLNLWRRDISNDVTDLICCWATRSAKTRIPMAGAAYRIALDPMRCLWTKPMKGGAGGSRNDAKTKFIPMLRVSPGIKQFVERCDKNALNNNQQMINGSIIDWEGTGSAKQLSGNPDDVVVQDECDGYVVTGNEAHPSILADERTKDASNPLRYKSCSPTVEDGVIWQWLMRSDLRRRFLPCPRCNDEPKRIPADFKGWFVLGWSPQYNVLPTKMPDGNLIPVAYTHWDKAAKLQDGSWNFERVMQTAHFKCPHCSGKILNHEKEWMDERGKWIATKVGAPGVAGFHLSSLYVTHDETAIGVLAKKFLMARDSGLTMKGFINNDLAEVDVSQEHGSNKIELGAKPVSKTDWVTILTADFHKNFPFLWFVVRKWCAFKLLPPFKIINGKPDFIDMLDEPENAYAKNRCLKLLDGHEPAWIAIAELMRFDSRTGVSPLVEFLISQKIVGKKLVKLFKEDAAGVTTEFRRLILLGMAEHEGAVKGNEERKKFRAARGGDSELVAAGNLELSGAALWQELREIEIEFEVGKGMTLDNRCTFIDCGFAIKFEREVLAACYERADHFKWYDPMSKNKPPLFHGLWKRGEPESPARHGYCLPTPADGWHALRGVLTNRPLGDGKINHELCVRVEDPYYGSAEAGSKMVEVLQVPQGLFWLRKNDLRLRRTKNIYTVSPKVSWFPKRYMPDGSRTLDSNFKKEDYERQLNEQFYNDKNGKVEPRHGRGGMQSKKHPYHLDDCETYQVAAATYHEFFEASEQK